LWLTDQGFSGNGTRYRRNQPVDEIRLSRADRTLRD
jgi:hypothetical protein